MYKEEIIKLLKENIESVTSYFQNTMSVASNERVRETIKEVYSDIILRYSHISNIINEMNVVYYLDVKLITSKVIDRIANYTLFYLEKVFNKYKGVFHYIQKSWREKIKCYEIRGLLYYPVEHLIEEELKRFQEINDKQKFTREIEGHYKGI